MKWLLTGATHADLAWLTRPDELLNNIYVVSEDGQSASKATKEDGLPWPVLLLLGSQSRVHILRSARNYHFAKCRELAVILPTKSSGSGTTAAAKTRTLRTTRSRL